MLFWVVLACGIASITVALLAPLLLTVGRWQLLHPRTALSVWFGAFFIGIALALAGLIIGVAGAVAASHTPTGSETLLMTILGWAGLGAFGAIAAFVAVSAEPVLSSETGALHSLAPIAISREQRRGFTLVRFESDQPIAFAAPGRPPEILLSTGMESLLPSAQLQAVLAHEYAHLRQHHAWATRIARINALCLPRTHSARALRRATTLLVELAADDQAARLAGPAHLANALSTLAAASNDAGLELRAERLVDKRWPGAVKRRRPPAAFARDSSS